MPALYGLTGTSRVYKLRINHVVETKWDGVRGYSFSLMGGNSDSFVTQMEFWWNITSPLHTKSAREIGKVDSS